MSTASEQTMNEYMMPLLDLAAFTGVSSQAIHKSVKTKGLQTYVIGGRSYLSPEAAREFMLTRGYQYRKLVLSLQMLKGGVAKTTTAMNVAIRANMYGARVLLIDLDQQANLSFAFNVEDQDARVWVDVLEGKSSIQEVIKQVTPTLHLIPSNLNNSVLDRILLSGKRNVATGVSQYLDQVKGNYDLVIIDTAPNLSAINTAASCASDRVVLPVNPDKFSFVGLAKTISDLENIKREFKAKFEPKILFTKFDGRETASHELLKLCIANYGDHMLKGFIRTSTDFKNTIQSGRTIFDQKSSAKAKEDYDLITREILGLPLTVGPS